MTRAPDTWTAIHCPCQGRNVAESYATRHCSDCQATLLHDHNVADDECIVAEQQWQAGAKPRKPQLACNHGLFSDSRNQKEMFT
jgi:hypothetical protein